MCCTLTLNGEIAPQFTNFSLIDQMNQQLDSRADYYGSPLPRVAIAPSHTAPSQWRSSFLVDCTVEICLFLPIFAYLILNDPLRNARGNRGNRHFLTRPAREFFYHESPSIVCKVPKRKSWKTKNVENVIIYHMWGPPKLSTIFWPLLAIFTLFHLTNLL